MLVRELARAYASQLRLDRGAVPVRARLGGVPGPGPRARARPAHRDDGLLAAASRRRLRRGVKLAIDLTGLALQPVHREARLRHHAASCSVAARSARPSAFDDLALCRYARRLRAAGAALRARALSGRSTGYAVHVDAERCTAAPMLVVAPLPARSRSCWRSASRCSWSWACPRCSPSSLFIPTCPTSPSPQKIVGGVNVATLLAIPFFIFAADIMARGMIAQRLTAMVRALVGHFRGGIGHTTVAARAWPSARSAGSAPATVAALGRLCYPELQRAGYSEKFSLGLIASSAECALLIPPSITLIIYGWLTGTSIAGAVRRPASWSASCSASPSWRWCSGRRAGAPARAASREPGASGWRALRERRWALGLPVIILGGIYRRHLHARPRRPRSPWSTRCSSRC